MDFASYSSVKNTDIAAGSIHHRFQLGQIPLDADLFRRKTCQLQPHCKIIRPGSGADDCVHFAQQPFKTDIVKPGGIFVAGVIDVIDKTTTVFSPSRSSTWVMDWSKETGF